MRTSTTTRGRKSTPGVFRAQTDHWSGEHKYPGPPYHTAKDAKRADHARQTAHQWLNNSPRLLICPSACWNRMSLGPRSISLRVTPPRWICSAQFRRLREEFLDFAQLRAWERCCERVKNERPAAWEVLPNFSCRLQLVFHWEGSLIYSDDSMLQSSLHYKVLE